MFVIFFIAAVWLFICCFADGAFQRHSTRFFFSLTHSIMFTSWSSPTQESITSDSFPFWTHFKTLATKKKNLNYLSSWETSRLFVKANEGRKTIRLPMPLSDTTERSPPLKTIQIQGNLTLTWAIKNIEARAIVHDRTATGCCCCCCCPKGVFRPRPFPRKAMKGRHASATDGGWISGSVSFLNIKLNVFFPKREHWTFFR